MKSIFSVLALGLSLATLPLVADEAPKNAAGTVITVSGHVSVISVKDSASSSLTPGQAVFPGDEIKTGANGRVQIVLLDGTQLKLNYLTDITLKDKDIEGKASPRGIALVKIALGDLWAKVTHKGSTLQFETPAAVAAVKGTNPLFSVAQDGTSCLSLFEGGMNLSSGGCGLNMSSMQQVCISKGEKACNATPQPLTSTSSFADDTSTTVTLNLDVTDQDGNQEQVQVQYGK
jgi:hypothetical protein